MSSPNQKRFYKTAEIADADEGGFDVQLDGRRIKTPAGRNLTVPTRALADAIAREWNAQGETIVPASLPLTKLANTAIDGVAGREAEIARDIVNYAATDLICYRAAYPAGLVSIQTQLWDPILTWIRERYRAPFDLVAGVKHVTQPAASLEAIKRAVSTLDPFRLAALHVMTSLTGSALIALAHAGGFLDTEATWAAAHVDEDWQLTKWGEDFEAAKHRQHRLSEFESASRFFNLSAKEHTV
jgi:chaperone required for assembly of F1-ATPase